jgi:hypothetical protein
MRAVLLCAVLALGCSKKPETKNEPAKQEPAKPAEKPADQPVAPAPTPPPPPPVANAAPPVDCAALLTAEDIEKACKTKVEVVKTPYEGKGDLMVCNRTIKTPNHETAQFGVSRFASTAAIDSWIDLDKKNNKEATFTDVAGLGDGAYSRKGEVKSLKTTEYDLGVRKGTFLLHFGYSVNEMNKKPPCTMEQLQDVAKAVLSRMP